MKIKSLLILSIISLAFLNSCSLPIQELETVEEAVFQDGTYVIDVNASTLYWEAYKPFSSHIGGISLRKGDMITKGGRPVAGSFTIDMTSISNTDIEDEGLRTSLINHLKSDDFFSVADYPEARYDITRILPYEGEGDYNYQIEGDLSLKGVTKPITILTKIEKGENHMNAHGSTMVDRTEFGITVRSGSFFEELGEKLIKDEFLLEMDLVASLH